MSHIIVFSLSVSLSKVTRVKNFGGIAQRTLNTMKDENEDSGQGARTIHDSFFRVRLHLLQLQRFWSHMVGE